MMSHQKFTKEVRTATLQGRTITVTHLTPVLSPEERERRKREIEQRLFDVYSKYEDTERKAT